MTTSGHTLEYERAGVGEAKLNAELAAFFKALESGDPVIKKDAAANGVDLAALREGGSGTIHAEERGGAGFGGVGELIVIFLVEKGLELAWEKVVKPYIDRSCGGDALGAPKPEG